MDNPVERALAYLRSLAALAERLAKDNIVVRRLHCDWSSLIEGSAADVRQLLAENIDKSDGNSK